MGGCQNYGPLLGPLNARCRIILQTPEGTTILTTTHMYAGIWNNNVGNSMEAPMVEHSQSPEP